MISPREENASLARGFGDGVIQNKIYRFVSRSEYDSLIEVVGVASQPPLIVFLYRSKEI
jgi:hypothetical protein